MQPRIISKTAIGSQRLSRIQLASGERLFIKLILNDRFFLSITELGSMNPVTIAVDWLISRFTGNRTAGAIDIWTLGYDVVDRETWRATIQFTFGHKGSDEDILSSVSQVVMYSPSIDELRRRLDLINAKLAELTKSDSGG
jgi:hypothetical protein